MLLVENISDENKQTLRAIYTTSQMEDITNRDANELLVRSNGIQINAANISINTSALNESGMYVTYGVDLFAKN